MTAEALSADLQRVEPAYRHAMTLRALISWGPLFLGALVGDRLLLADTPLAGLAPLVAGVLAVFAILIAPGRVYRRLGYAVDGRLLRTVRGWLFHVDTVVPFVRVQHIDVTRSLFDKMFGTASLIVHTAGTHNSIVTLPGLSPDRAAEIREIIRGSIRTDFE